MLELPLVVIKTMCKITGEDTGNNSQIVQSSIKLAICVCQTSVEKMVTTSNSSMKYPLLPKELPSWKKKVRHFSSKIITVLRRNRGILIVLFWQFSTGFFFNLFLTSTSYIQNADVKESIAVTVIVSVVFLFSPLAGYVADVKFGRIKILLCGTYFMLISIILTLIICTIVTLSVHTFNISGYTLLAVLFVSMLMYCFGAVLFLSNVIQFGTDQLRDAPTRYSVRYIYAYFWSDSISKLIARATYLPGHEIVINSLHNIIAIDKTRSILMGAILSLSMLSSTLILFLVIKKQRQWFLTENNRENPYKLVYNVIYFAVHHKKPIRRSAFTYCENERPSRLDFGKQRYGGPYTTEQVEDVKVMFNILKIVFSFGPVFLLECSAASSFIHHAHYVPHSEVTKPLPILLLDYGLLVPLTTVVCIPLCQCVVKPLLSKYAPNMFKRMGIALGILTISFFVYLILDIVAYSSNENHGYFHYHMCWRNTSYILNRSYITLPNAYISVLQQILFSLYQLFLYISAYEFISCQSPQHMKGLLFGLFYALRSFYQVSAAITIFLFMYNWNSKAMSCATGFYMYNFSIGTAILITYSIVARKYKYRKRDDICHIYKFAEDYYSNSQ